VKALYGSQLDGCTVQVENGVNELILALPYALLKKCQLVLFRKMDLLDDPTAVNG
jgi:hypothetical protein